MQIHETVAFIERLISLIDYRPIKKSDFQRVRRLINQTWQIDRFCSDEKLLETGLDLFLRSSLMHSNYTLVAEENGEVVGFILGRTDRDFNLFGTLFRHLPQILWKTLLFIAQNKRNQKLLQFVGVLNSSYKKILKVVKTKFDGELVLFIVDRKQQGKGIGKTLLNHFLDTCRSKSIRRLRVFTDTECNYGYYDHNGFRRLHELQTAAEMLQGTLPLTIFLYEYPLGVHE
ncbi:MAG TPA: hypothetical protein DCE14_06460 [Kosmotogaceae bacterium]|nr:hypothetical protein [Kosmotogaceae bacterium]